MQLAFDESVTEPSVTHYICTETPELNFEECSKKIEDWRQEEEDSRLRKIDDRQQAEDSKERSVPRAPNATSENDSPWNYRRRRYLPMKDLEIDFPKYAEDLAKNAEASTNKGTGKGYKGSREGTKGEQEQKGGKKGGEGKGKQEHPPKGALPKAAATAAPELKKHRPTKETPKETPKAIGKDTTRARKEEEEAMHGSLPSKNGSPRNGITHRDTMSKELGEKPTPTPKSP